MPNPTTTPGHDYLLNTRGLIADGDDLPHNVAWVPREQLLENDHYRDAGGPRVQRNAKAPKWLPDNAAGVLRFRWHWGGNDVYEDEGVDAEGRHVDLLDVDGEPTVKRKSQRGKGIGSSYFAPRPLHGRLNRDDAHLIILEGALDAIAAVKLGLVPDDADVIAVHGCHGLTNPNIVRLAKCYDRVTVYPHHLDTRDIGERKADELHKLADRGHIRVVKSTHDQPHDLADVAVGKVPADAYPAVDTRRELMVPATSVDLSKPTTEWLWENWIQKGRINIISGHGEAGKGLAAGAIVAGLSSKTPLPGAAQRAAPVTFGWVSSDDEDGHRHATARLAAAGADLSQGFVYPCDDIEDPAAIAQIARECAEKDLELCVFDSHVTWFEETKEGTKVRAELKAAFRPLIKKGLTPLLIAHHRQSNEHESDPRHTRIAGNASGLVGAARVVLEVEKLGEGDHVLRMVKGNNGARPDELHFSVQTCYRPVAPVLTWTGSSPPGPTSGGGGSGPSVPSDDRFVEVIEGADEPPTKTRICKLLFGETKGKKPKCSRPQNIAAGKVVDRLVRAGRLKPEAVMIGGKKQTGYLPGEGRKQQEAAGSTPPASTPPVSRKQEAPLVRGGASCPDRGGQGADTPISEGVLPAPNPDPGPPKSDPAPATPAPAVVVQQPEEPEMMPETPGHDFDPGAPPADRPDPPPPLTPDFDPAEAVEKIPDWLRQKRREVDRVNAWMNTDPADGESLDEMLQRLAQELATTHGRTALRRHMPAQRVPPNPTADDLAEWPLPVLYAALYDARES